MKLADTILLLRNGYTKAEITAMNEESSSNEFATLKAENEKLKADLEKAQKDNTVLDNQNVPKRDNEVNLNDILKG